MTQKEIVRWEHIEAYRAKNMADIPAEILPLVKAQVEHMDKCNALKGKKVPAEVDIND